MKIGIYNPYLDSFGGGERYTLTAAAHWSQVHDVDIFWDSKDLISKAGKVFGLDLSRVKMVKNIFAIGNVLLKVLETRKYDCIVVVSDGSLPVSLAKNTIAHFQVPFDRVYLAPWKKLMYKLIVVNSEFTKLNLDNSLTIPRSVIYPPVYQTPVSSMEKSKIILSVGRFAGLYNAKKHDILIKAFRVLYDDASLKGWRLAIAGSLLDSDKKDFESLKVTAVGIPVDFYPNCPYTILQSLYESARIYWHAAGYGESKPERMEHFGISTVEAMSAGCVPLSFNCGGQPEIIANGENGILWNTPGELIKKTLEIVGDDRLRKSMSKRAIERAKDFSPEKFTAAIDSILQT